jgi:hypothetical protein
MFKRRRSSNTVRGKGVWMLLALLMGCALGALGLLWWHRQAGPETLGQSAAPSDTVNQKLADPEVVAAGRVVDPNGKPLSEAWVALSLHDDKGTMVWHTVIPTDSSGVFSIRPESLPRIPAVHAGVVAAEAPRHLSAQVNVVVQITQEGKAEVTPRRIDLRLEPFDPLLTLIVLLPAFLGLIYAVVHLTEYSRPIGVTYAYAVTTTILWGFVAAWLSWRFVSKGQHLISLFFGDVFISSGVVVFAFLGSFAYAAFSLQEKEPDFFSGTSPEAQAKQRKVLLALAGRILVAPYIAVVAYGIFSATFPTLRTGPFALFFGFFTGLYIKPVVEALNDIGMRLLSPEETKKIADRMTRTEVPEAPQAVTSTTAGARPNQAFLDAVAAARKELLQKENVIGVDSGVKTGTGEQAISVYVYKKKALPPGDKNLVPETFQGFKTDVVELPPVDPKVRCREVMSRLSWGKINEDVKKTGASVAAASRTMVKRVGQVVLLVDPNEALFSQKAGDQNKIFEIIGAYSAAHSELGNDYDFVSFELDVTSGLPCVGDYHVAVFSDIEGTNYARQGYPGSFAEREKWHSPRLRACTVHSYRPQLQPYHHLHELGHYWSAYATYKSSQGSSSDSYGLQIGTEYQDRYHWGQQFDDGRSCMDYDMIVWNELGNGTFARQYLKDDSEFVFCNLDLYLMGLLRPEQVGPIRILRNLTQKPGQVNIFSADVEEISIEQVIWSCGQRVPSESQSPKSFQQAFVVVSKDENQGTQFAKKVDEFMRRFEEAFGKATRNRAALKVGLI